MSRIHEALLKAEQDRAAQQDSTMTAANDKSVFASVAAVASAFIPPPDEIDESSFVKEQKHPAAPATTFQSYDWNPNVSKMVFCEPANNPVLVEVFRTLRSKIYNERTHKQIKTILVTSASIGDGKSFVAGNLAHSIAHQSEKVLLVDADLRRPTLHECLGAPNTLGLTQYLRGECEFNAIVQRWKDTSLHFVPSGAAAAKTPELLLSSRMADFIEAAKPNFDWLILDSPPCTIVSDAMALANHSDGVLVVVGHGTKIDAAQSMLKELRDKIILGTVLNRAKIAGPQYSYATAGR